MAEKPVLILEVSRGHERTVEQIKQAVLKACQNGHKLGGFYLAKDASPISIDRYPHVLAVQLSEDHGLPRIEAIAGLKTRFPNLREIRFRQNAEAATITEPFEHTDEVYRRLNNHKPF